MINSRGRGNHGLEVSDDIIHFLTHCIETSNYTYEVTLKTGVDYKNIVRILELKRAHATTIEKIKTSMQKQEVC